MSQRAAIGPYPARIYRFLKCPEAAKTKETYSSFRALRVSSRGLLERKEGRWGMKEKRQLSPEEVERQRSRFEAWQKKNPSKTFKDYFAETVEAKLQKGRPHETLGGNLRQGEYTTSGRGIFERLV